MKKILTVIFITLSISLTAQDKKPIKSNLRTGVDKVPVAPRCDENLNNPELRVCLNKYLARITAQNISMDFIRNQKLDSGDYTIDISFKIDYKGNITDVSTDSDNKKIDRHFIKAIKKAKNLKPAIHDGKPVNILYVLPIQFRVQ